MRQLHVYNILLWSQFLPSTLAKHAAVFYVDSLARFSYLASSKIKGREGRREGGEEGGV